MRARAIAVLLAVGIALAALLAPGAEAAHAARYVVQLTADPLSRYDGGVPGLRS